jgi:hypothetical protein
MLLNQYAKQRKAYTNKQKIPQIKNNTSVLKSLMCSGYQNEQLCPMNKVEQHGLLEEHTFQLKDVPQLCIEAILCGITTRAN